jgi:hypothetical protein
VSQKGSSLVFGDVATALSKSSPSIFMRPTYADICSKSNFPPAVTKIASEKEMEKTSLKWTAVCVGFFLDYFGMPKVKSHLRPITMVLDVVAAKAAIPGSGNVPGAFTYSQDVGRFVAALLTLSEWEKESYIIGDKLTWSECLAIAEDVRGKFAAE